MKVQNSNWHAWYNMMPPGPPMLHVTGEIDVGDTSTGATLEFDSIEKSNPPNLVLRIVDRTIFVPRDDGDTRVRLHYTEAGSPGYYGSVKIVLGGSLVATIDHVGMAY